MVVSGVPERKAGPVDAAVEIARMSLALIHLCRTFVIPHEPHQPLSIRVGIHSGRSVSESLNLIIYLGLYLHVLHFQYISYYF